jgi:hypothetical protein
MNAAPIPPEAATSAPKAAAVAGILFSALLIPSVVLIRLAVPAEPTDSGVWLTDRTLLGWVSVALNLVPFAGIAFLWFMGVLRNRVGLLEDRFFSTVFLGSGLLFVATLFAAAAIARGYLEAFALGGAPVARNDEYAIGRATVYTLMNSFGVKMAAVFMFVTSTISLRTEIVPRWIAFLGFGLGLALLLSITDFPWIALVFPLWVLLLSTYILVTDLR